jgi:hypothetical protein
MIKGDFETVSQRVGQIYRLLLQRIPTKQIVAACVKSWGVSERSVYYYLKQARQQMTADTQRDRQDALAEHLALRRDLFKQAMEQRQLAIALSVLSDEARLLGLYFGMNEHLKVLLDAGYIVYEPKSKEHQAFLQQQEAIALGSYVTFGVYDQN